MPIAEETVVHIVCDNPACPGNDLSANDRAGWSFVTVEVLDADGTGGVANVVYCCADCVSADADAVVERTRALPPPSVNTDFPPVDVAAGEASANP